VAEVETVAAAEERETAVEAQARVRRRRRAPNGLEKQREPASFTLSSPDFLPPWHQRAPMPQATLDRRGTKRGLPSAVPTARATPCCTGTESAQAAMTATPRKCHGRRRKRAASWRHEAGRPREVRHCRRERARRSPAKAGRDGLTPPLPPRTPGSAREILRSREAEYERFCAGLEALCRDLGY